MTAPGKAGILLEENHGKHRDFLCFVLVQQDMIRTIEATQTLFHREVILETTNYKVRTAVGIDDV